MQGFAARALGGLDLSWLAGSLVAAALYAVLGPRAHQPYEDAAVVNPLSLTDRKCSL